MWLVWNWMQIFESLLLLIFEPIQPPFSEMPVFEVPNGTICFDQRGSRASTPILLIHGLGCQLIHWPDSLLDGLVNAGYRTVVFDNRDTGLSFECGAPPPTIPDLIQALDDPNSLTPSYTLADMATDSIALLDHIGQSGAHIVGVSMGGMIAQYMAINHPERVFSLTLLMSSTGSLETPKPGPEVIGALATSIVTPTREEKIEATRNLDRLFGGPHYDSCEVGVGRFVEQAYDRAHRPDGVLRQLAAILSDGDRRELLRKVETPSLAFHGNADPLVDSFGSKDLAATLPNCQLQIIEKLGHDLPEPVIPVILEEILNHIESVEAAR